MCLNTGGDLEYPSGFTTSTVKTDLKVRIPARQPRKRLERRATRSSVRNAKNKVIKVLFLLGVLFPVKERGSQLFIRGTRTLRRAHSSSPNSCSARGIV